MHEIEVKILDIDKKAVEKRLRSLGARKVLDADLVQDIYDFPDKRLRKAHKVLRLRNDGTKNIITFKRPIGKENSHAKVRDEQEVTVDSFKTMTAIFGLLGLKRRASLRKHRTSYSLDGVHFDIDKYLSDLEYDAKKVPTFLEIEAKYVKTIHKYAVLLGFSPSDCKPWNGFQVIKHYGLKKRKNR